MKLFTGDEMWDFLHKFYHAFDSNTVKRLHISRFGFSSYNFIVHKFTPELVSSGSQK